MVLLQWLRIGDPDTAYILLPREIILTSLTLHESAHPVLSSREGTLKPSLSQTELPNILEFVLAALSFSANLSSNQTG